MQTVIPEEKIKLRAKLERDVQAFLAEGNKILDVGASSMLNSEHSSEMARKLPNRARIKKMNKAFVINSEKKWKYLQKKS